MSALSGVKGGYSVTQPLEDQMKLTIAKAKLHAVEAANEAKISAMEHVVEELHLAKSDGTGALLDIAV